MKSNANLLQFEVASCDNAPSVSLGYRQSLASSTNLLGSTLELCLATIHADIISSWNFNDPHGVRSLSYCLLPNTLISAIL